MASNIIGEGILIVASVIVAGTLAGVVMSKVGVFESTFTATSEGQKNTMLTKIKVIYTTNSTDDDVNVWVKNVGINPIVDTTLVDVYFGNVSSAQRYAYEVGTNDNTWEYNGGAPTVWQRMQTVQIDIDEEGLTPSTTYELRVTSPNGVSDDFIFSTNGS